jgi:hypothetical protein
VRHVISGIKPICSSFRLSAIHKSFNS